MKVIGKSFLSESSVELLNLPHTAFQSAGDLFCLRCRQLRELLFPGTLASLVSVGSPIRPLSLLVLPVASGMGIREFFSASVLAGVVGLRFKQARPLWPAE
jgi:hypothetical protein